VGWPHLSKVVYWQLLQGPHFQTLLPLTRVLVSLPYSLTKCCHVKSTNVFNSSVRLPTGVASTEGAESIASLHCTLTSNLLSTTELRPIARKPMAFSSGCN
jgi:hypothetical protein